MTFTQNDCINSHDGFLSIIDFRASVYAGAFLFVVTMNDRPGIKPSHLRGCIVRPTIEYLGLWSPAAQELLMGTAAQESACGRYLRQLSHGPALGIYQMEPATHDDIHINFLRYHPALQKAVSDLASPLRGTTAQEMTFNLAYATAMARIHYYRVPSAIPKDLRGQAEYWKEHYNTPAGRGEVDHFVFNYNRIIK